jgi:hypothetical protein
MDEAVGQVPILFFLAKQIDVSSLVSKSLTFWLWCLMALLHLRFFPIIGERADLPGKLHYHRKAHGFKPLTYEVKKMIQSLLSINLYSYTEGRHA